MMIVETFHKVAVDVASLGAHICLIDLAMTRPEGLFIHCPVQPTPCLSRCLQHYSEYLVELRRQVLEERKKAYTRYTATAIITFK